MCVMSLFGWVGGGLRQETCGELLGDLVTDDNLFFFLDVVDKYEVKALEAACGSHLAEHFQDLVNNGKLDDLEPSTWAEIVKTDDIRVKYDTRTTRHARHTTHAALCRRTVRCGFWTPTARTWAPTWA